MTWTEFFLYIALFYLVYYAITLVVDVFRKPNFTGAQDTEAYSFESDLSEFDENPTIVEEDDPESQSNLLSNQPITKTDESEGLEINEVNPVKSSGGVTSLDSLFALAKEGTIELKKSIVYS